MAAPASPDFRHSTPSDLDDILRTDAPLREKWDGLTDLARNEWICWMTSGKKAETRTKRLARLQEDILAGKRRPCCWPGCPHRRESARKWVDA
ncbi:YdeI/OmpD-associated family protein [Altererythrobacter sp.]|uniref:YdeI/OmpD-associated family protein n=1 Tax=Altererythrobacter sp. TaxID=1872480 RepID=UPI003D093497